MCVYVCVCPHRSSTGFCVRDTGELTQPRTISLFVLRCPVNATIGVFGVITFCSDVKANLLDNFPDFLPWILVARIAFIFNLLFTAPLVLRPILDAISVALLRDSVFDAAADGRTADGSNSDGYAGAGGRDAALSAPLLNAQQGEGIEDRSHHMDSPRSTASGSIDAHQPRRGRILIDHAVTIVLLVAVSSISIAVGDRLEVVIGVVGACGGGLTMFVLPSLFSLKLLSKKGNCFRIFCAKGSLMLLAAVGLTFAVTGLVSNVVVKNLSI